MKITGFRPLIITQDAENAMKVFEELGFERRHTKEGIEGNTTSSIMKDANGNHIAIAQSQGIPQDMTAVSINVDNFEEAYDFLISKGFVNIAGDKVTDTGSSKAVLLFSPSGYAVNIAEHIKE